MTQAMFKIFYRRHDDGKVDVWISNEPSQALQEFKDESDINNLVARYKQTGAFYDALAARNQKSQPRVPIFEDVSEIPDFAAAQEVINQGKEAFAALSPSIRSTFSNSPELFLAFLAENAKKPEMLRKAGILAPDSAQVGVQGSKTPANVSAPQQAVAASGNASEK